MGKKSKDDAVSKIKSNLKGWWGERLSQFGFWLSLDKEIYKRLHNIIVDTGNGTTQIDHVYLSRYGIFVVETKQMQGWIFGSEKDKEWTQKFENGKTFKFQNPLHQNYKHVKAISGVLGIDEEHVHSVIVFVSEEQHQIKTRDNLPDNVATSPVEAGFYIKKFSKIVFGDDEVSRLENELLHIKENQISTSEHVQGVKERYAQTDKCPKCGSPMVQRAGKKDDDKLDIYMACSAFPKCKHTVKTGEALYKAPPQEKPAQEAVQEPENQYNKAGQCPRCGNALVERIGKSGNNKGRVFMGCSTFPKCRYMSGVQEAKPQEPPKPVKPQPPKQAKPQQPPKPQEPPKPVKPQEAKSGSNKAAVQCPRCGNALVERIGKSGNYKGKAFMGCSTFPKCRYMSGVQEAKPPEPPKQAKPQEAPKPAKPQKAKSSSDKATTQCPRCGNALVERIGKSGSYKGKAFMGCSTFPKCRYMADIAKPTNAGTK